MVYKNLRVVRANDADEHPLVLGPVFIHRDATFEAYNFFLSTIKGSLYPQNSISSFDIHLGDGIYIGSDEERAIVNAIVINFPGSNQLLCWKHLKDGALNYMQSKVGVPQKDRKKICDAIVGDKGAINADDSIDFERKSRKVLEKAYVYPKFVNYFKNKLQPSMSMRQRENLMYQLTGRTITAKV